MQPRSAFFFFCWFCLGFLNVVQGQDLFSGSTATGSPVEHFAVSGDGLTGAATLQGRGAVLLFDIPSGLPRLYLHGHQGEVRYLTFTENDSKLITVADGEVIFWDLPAGVEQQRIALPLSLPAGPREYLYDPSRELLFCSVGSNLYCYSLRQGGLAKILESKENAAGINLRASLLAQAPAREELWVLDLNAGELFRVDLIHFRPREKVRIPGALALAVENGRTAVLAASPDRSSASQHTVHLLNGQLEKEGIFSVALEAPEPGALKMHFSTPHNLSIASREGVVDLNLVSGLSTPFDFGRSYAKLFFRRNGSLLLLHPHHLEVIDQWGRCEAQYGLLPGRVLLYDDAIHRFFLLQEGALFGEDGRRYCQLDPAHDQVVCADLRDGVLAVGGPTGAITLYDLESGALLRTLPGQGRPYSRLLVMPESGRVAAFTVTDRVAGLYDWENGSVIAWLPAAEGGITTVAAHGDSIYLGDESGRISIFDLQKGQPRGTHRLATAPIRSVAAGERTLAIGSRKGIAIYGLPNLDQRYKLIGHDNAVRWLRLSEAEDQLLSVAGDAIVRRWSLTSGHLEDVWESPDQIPDRAFFSTGQPRVLYSTVAGKIVGVPEATAFVPAGGERPPVLTPGLRPRITFSGDGALLAVLDPGTGVASIWETARGTRLHQIMATGKTGFSDVQFFDQREILIGTCSGGFEYWDARTGNLLKRVNYGAVGLAPGSVLKSPRADSLWTFQVDGDRVVRMCAATADIIYSHQAPAGEHLRELALSADGRWLAAAGQERIYLFDNNREEPMTIIKDALAANIVFGPEGHLLVYSRPESGEIVVYDLFQGKVRFRAPGQGATFLDNRRLVVYRVTSSGYTALDIWDCLLEGPVATLDVVNPGSGISSIGAFPGTGMVVTADAAANILFWVPSNSPLTAETSVETKDYLIHAFPLRPGSDLSLAEPLLATLSPLNGVGSPPPPARKEPKIGVHVITKSTSLRTGAGADKDVILRLPVGARVEIVEETNDPYWARIRFGGHTGWAKKALLEKDRLEKETL